MVRKILFIVFLMPIYSCCYGQSCTSNPTTITTTNFSSINWTAGGGASCPVASSTYSAEMIINVENGATLTMDYDVTFNGNFPITNNGTNAYFYVPAGVTVTINGDLGSATNNNFTYRIDGTLIVSGTIYGKNSNAFEGSGSVSAGGLDFKGEPTCDPCEIDFDVDTCEPPSSFCDYALPIELLNFTVVTDEKGAVNLNWSTSSEINFDFFTILRSSDGISYEKIAEIPGNGWTSEITTYSYKDSYPLIGSSYYRLKATDLDGTSEYFQPVMISQGAASNEIFILKNPVQQEGLLFRLNFSPKEDIQVIILSTSGRIVFNNTYSSQRTTYALKNDFESGAYILKVITSEGTYSNRFLKN